MADQTLIRSLVASSLKTEETNARIARENIANARNILARSPHRIGSAPWIETLDKTLEEINKTLPTQFRGTEALQRGVNDGRLYLENAANIPKNSAFWNWTPTIPLNAIGLIDSLMARDIRNTTAELQTRILRAVQTGLASGMSIDEIQRQILGTGLRGEKGRDGIFRTASNRADMQARTITNDLVNRGALITYQQAATISPSLRIRKLWQTSNDNRTSARCISLSGQIRDLDEPFEAADGWTGQTAPAHPFCRSRVTATSEKWSPLTEKEFAAARNTSTPRPQPTPVSLNPPTPPAFIKSPIPELQSGTLYTRTYYNEAIDRLTADNPAFKARINQALEIIKDDQILIYDSSLNKDEYLFNLHNLFTKEQLTQWYKSSWHPFIPGENSTGFTSSGRPYIVLNPYREITKSKVRTSPVEVKTIRREWNTRRQSLIDLPEEDLISNLPFSVNYDHRGKTKASSEYRQVNTLIHEVGHRLHYRGIRKDFDLLEVPKDYRGTHSVSFYGRATTGETDRTRSLESHAEAYALYVFDPDALEYWSPSMYNRITYLLKEFGP